MSTKAHPAFGKHGHDDRWCKTCDSAWIGSKYTEDLLTPQITKLKAALVACMDYVPAWSEYHLDGCQEDGKDDGNMCKCPIPAMVRRALGRKP